MPNTRRKTIAKTEVGRGYLEQQLVCVPMGSCLPCCYSFRNDDAVTLRSGRCSSQNGSRRVVEESNIRLTISDVGAVPSSTGFYNPKMKLYRDLVVLSTLVSFMATDSTDGLRLLDAFSGTGALALRWASAVSKAGLKAHIVANDRSEDCAELIRENCKANGCRGWNVEVTNEEANLLLARCAVQPSLKPFDAIHLDPFGCCTSFLDNALRAIANGGVLSLTSTDNSALFNRGYARVCLRHYGVKLAPDRREGWRETAARVILAALAVAAARHDRAIEVLLVASFEHFVLCSCRVLLGAKKADACLENVRMVSEEGPLWAGPLWESKHMQAMISLGRSNADLALDAQSLRVAERLAEEAAVSSAQACHLHNIARATSRAGLSCIPKADLIVQKLRRAGFEASTSHLELHSIRTTASLTDFEQIVVSCQHGAVLPCAPTEPEVGSSGLLTGRARGLHSLAQAESEGDSGPASANDLPAPVELQVKGADVVAGRFEAAPSCERSSGGNVKKSEHSRPHLPRRPQAVFL